MRFFVLRVKPPSGEKTRVKVTKDEMGRYRALYNTGVGRVFDSTEPKRKRSGEIGGY